MQKIVHRNFLIQNAKLQCLYFHDNFLNELLHVQCDVKVIVQLYILSLQVTKINLHSIYCLFIYLLRDAELKKVNIWCYHLWRFWLLLLNNGLPGFFLIRLICRLQIRVLRLRLHACLRLLKKSWKIAIYILSKHRPNHSCIWTD